MGTAERRLAIMKHLCRVRHTTMSDLAHEFSVSVRTIQRDIFEITFLMPIEVRSGKYTGGVYVMEGYTWDKAYMRAEDIALLNKIKTVAEKQERLILDKDALQQLEKIISTYSIPQ